MITKNNESEKKSQNKTTIFNLNSNFNFSKDKKICFNNKKENFIDYKINPIKQNEHFYKKLDFNSHIINQKIQYVVDHFSKNKIIFKKKKIFNNSNKIELNDTNDIKNSKYQNQNFANNEIISSSIDVTYKDFEGINLLIKNYYSSFSDLTNKNEKDFDIIEKKCINVFKNRILDLKLILCTNFPTQCQKRLFETIIFKMKYVLMFFEKDDYYKLFYKIVNEFLALDLSYLHFIKILECYFCFENL